MGAVLILSWIMVSAGGKPEILPLWEWHKSLGLVVLAVTTARIVWRFIDPPPPALDALSAIDHAVARTTYVLFFAIMLAMPISGYLL